MLEAFDENNYFDEKDLELNSYDYNLPLELIAQRPISDRSKCRLMVYDKKTGEITHGYFDQLESFLAPKSLLVLNNSKVFPARMKAFKCGSGAKAELFMLSLSSSSIQNNLYPCLIRSNHKKKIGDQFFLKNNKDLVATISSFNGEGQFLVEFNSSEDILKDFFFKEGLIPIPPYIRQGESDEKDKTDYQTVFAGNRDKELGSVAAPTAGLHFDDTLLNDLNGKGHKHAFVTLHVGLGTFLPVKSEKILEHEMHEESYFIDDKNLSLIKKTYEDNENVIAVGTTSLRVLESSYSSKEKNLQVIPDYFYQTRIFLHPGKKVSSINGLITNFHLPKSSLLMLVSSLIGRQKALELYEIAIKEKYRFFSYGDAMFIRL